MDDDFISLKTKGEGLGAVSIRQSCPTVHLDGKQAKACNADDMKHGEIRETLMRVRCKSIGDSYGDSYGDEKSPSVTLELLACTEFEECDEDDEDEKEEEDEGDGDEAEEEKPQSKPRDNAHRTIIVGP